MSFSNSLSNGQALADVDGMGGTLPTQKGLLGEQGNFLSYGGVVDKRSEGAPELLCLGHQ